jgi:hypothetical protein
LLQQRRVDRLPAGLFTPPVVVNGTVYLTSWNGEGPGIIYAFGI